MPAAPERSAIAKQLRETRTREKDPRSKIKIDRDLIGYQNDLGGLEFFFDYIRTLSSDLVLDIGAGTTKGIFEISESSLGRNLRFLATGLVKHPEIDSFIGRERFRQTSAEVLRGVADQSVAGALALFSLTFSAVPEVAVRSIDRVLVPGGILKAVFWHIGEGTCAEFLPVLRELGYDVCLLDGDDNVMWDKDILLAIKPGKENGNSARSIMNNDGRKYFEYEETDPDFV